MRRGHFFALLVAVSVGGAIAALAGYVNRACAHSCPPGCIDPPQCTPGFYWKSALALGVPAFVIALVIGLAVVSAFRSDQ
jgi:predicted benzoate:H+ symporter BenE